MSTQFPSGSSNRRSPEAGRFPVTPPLGLPDRSPVQLPVFPDRRRDATPPRVSGIAPDSTRKHLQPQLPELPRPQPQTEFAPRMAAMSSDANASGQQPDQPAQQPPDRTPEATEPARKAEPIPVFPAAPAQEPPPKNEAEPAFHTPGKFEVIKRLAADLVPSGSEQRQRVAETRVGRILQRYHDQLHHKHAPTTPAGQATLLDGLFTPGSQGVEELATLVTKNHSDIVSFRDADETIVSDMFTKRLTSAIAEVDQRMRKLPATTGDEEVEAARATYQERRDKFIEHLSQINPPDASPQPRQRKVPTQPPHPPLPDRTVVNELRGPNNEQAWVDVYQNNAPLLYRRALEVTGGNTEDAADLVQSAFTNTVARIAQGDAMVEGVEMSLTNAFTHAARSYTQASYAQPVPLDEAFSPTDQSPMDLEAHGIGVATLREWGKVLVNLSHRQFDLLIARAEGVPLADIARALGVPESTIKGRLNIARQSFLRETNMKRKDIE